MGEKIFSSRDLCVITGPAERIPNVLPQHYSKCAQTFLIVYYLKVPKCEIFDPFFFTPINPIWVDDLRTGEENFFFRRLREIFAILVFLRRLSLR